jgi:hypothetical protein
MGGSVPKGAQPWCRRRGVGGITSRTTHLRSSSQEVFHCYEGLFAAKARSGELFFLRLSQYFTSL